MRHTAAVLSEGGVVTALERAYYRQEFRIALLEKEGQEFQDWFCELARRALGPDFEPIGHEGARGDQAADGRRRSDGTIFQCYAPHTVRADRVRKKIRSDFTSALRHWPRFLKHWVFVHNIRRGLGPTANKELDALGREHPAVKTATWSKPELTELFDQLELADCEWLFGPAPSAEDLEGVTPAHVAEVIRHLEQAKPEPGREPLAPPSVDKIEKNDLSPDVLDLLSAGKRKDYLAERYFEKEPGPEAGERVAEAFRQRYASLKESAESPDDIFAGLQRFAGHGGSPKHQVAVLAVLSYLFDRCDIFEDPRGVVRGRAM